MVNKRGAEDLSLQSIITIFLVTLLFATLVFFLVNNATGNLAKKQILAKQLCLVTIESKQGMSINVSFDGLIEKKENGFLIKKDKLDTGYYYPCYNKDFMIYQEGKNFIIKIE
jgi:hypothetical protein